MLPLSSNETLSQPRITEFLSDSEIKTQAQVPGSEGAEIVSKSQRTQMQSSAWKVYPYGRSYSRHLKEATNTAASSAEKLNSAQSPKEPSQKLSASNNVTCKSEGEPGKHKQQKTREGRNDRKRMINGMSDLFLTSLEHAQASISASGSTKWSSESSSTQSTQKKKAV